mgnify:FL=1
MPPDEHATTPRLAQRTRDNYEKTYQAMIRAAQLRRWDGSDEGRLCPIPDADLIDDLLANHNRLGHQTLMKMKSALIYKMRGTHSQHLIDRLQSPDFSNQLKAAAQTSAKGKRGLKVIPEADLAKIEAHLRTTRGFGQKALIFLQATIAAGLRPFEWSHAFWEDRLGGRLRVKNAKNKAINALNQRSDATGVVFKEYSPGEATFRIVQIDPADIELVDAQVLLVRAAIIRESYGRLPDEIDDDFRYICFKPYYDRIRVALHRACKSIFPNESDKVYCLYDARSTFAANRRARDGLRSAAGALGHNSEKISKEVAAFYGNRYAAWSGYKHRPALSNTGQQTDANPDTNGIQAIPVKFNIQKPRG